MASKVRIAVVQTLLAWDQERENEYGLNIFEGRGASFADGRDRAFFKRLTQGCIERLIELDYILDAFSKFPMQRQRPILRWILRVSLYQMLYMDSVPDHAILSEALGMAVKFGFQGSKSYVNGLLRSILRQKDQLPYPNFEKNPLLALSVRASIPTWILSLWMDSYGLDIVRTMVEQIHTPRPVTVHFLPFVCAQMKEKYLAQWTALGITYNEAIYPPNAYELRHLFGVESLPGYEEGAFYVQDPSSALAVACAGIRPGDFVVDVCAAPGGKSIRAALLGAHVLARDVNEAKVERIRENINRLNLSTLMTIQCFDARTTDNSLYGKADVVLMDVPCSGLGVIQKKPDIKYRLTKESLPKLIDLAWEIASNSWQYLKPGGTLLYSTCTLNPMENERMIDRLCESFPLERVSLQDCWPQCFPEIRQKTQELCTRTIFPGFYPMDGFFFAKLRRKK
ncbi:MAG: 16S rRNA (cytosine(967)-C(5))-methyltransferase RsmB [Clostridium sp.]|jgi:16S rRNA (cytosine967-C5)-methyltransferase|nr:16S rRNA (cytosine(967)-C(5))-methyltransferase RsmB [Clostridium sp.]